MKENIEERIAEFQGGQSYSLVSDTLPSDASAWSNLNGCAPNSLDAGFVGPLGNTVSKNLDKPVDMTICLSGTLASATGELTFNCNTFQFGWDSLLSPNTLAVIFDSLCF